MKLNSAATKLLLTVLVLGSGQKLQALFVTKESTPLRQDAEGLSTRLEIRENSDPGEIIIAVIDTGLDTSNPLFQPYLWHSSRSRFEYGWNFRNNSADIDDEHGHGTHVAGIIIQELKRLSPLVEVGKPVKLMILKYFDEKASGETNLSHSLKAFRYALDNGANVINYSGGGLAPSEEEEALVKEAERRGVILIAAAGNEAMNSDRHPFYPANYPVSNVISVGALDQNQTPLASTNYGRRNVDLMTVGQKIPSVLPGGRIGVMTGTSQATAFVTATVALLLASRPTPLATTEVLDQIFLSTTSSLALSSMTRTGGRLDAEKSLRSRGHRHIASDERLVNTNPVSDSFFAAEGASN